MDGKMDQETVFRQLIGDALPTSWSGRSEAGASTTLSSFTLRRERLLGGLVKRCEFIGSSLPSPSSRFDWPCRRK
jgi:hypothetical protein